MNAWPCKILYRVSSLSLLLKSPCKWICGAAPFLVYHPPTCSSWSCLQFWHSVNTTHQAPWLVVFWLWDWYMQLEIMRLSCLCKCVTKETKVVFKCSIALQFSSLTGFAVSLKSLEPSMTSLASTSPIPQVYLKLRQYWTMASIPGIGSFITPWHPV